MPHPNLEPRMSSGPRPWATPQLDLSGAMRDTEPPSPAELAEDARLDRRRGPLPPLDCVTREDFLRGIDPDHADDPF